MEGEKEANQLAIQKNTIVQKERVIKCAEGNTLGANPRTWKKHFNKLRNGKNNRMSTEEVKKEMPKMKKAVTG